MYFAKSSVIIAFILLAIGNNVSAYESELTESVNEFKACAARPAVVTDSTDGFEACAARGLSSKGSKAPKGTKVPKSSKEPKSSKSTPTPEPTPSPTVHMYTMRKVRKLISETFEETRFDRAGISSIQSIEDIAGISDGSVRLDGDLFFEMPNLLSKEECDALTDYYKSRTDTTGKAWEEFGVSLTAEELIVILGEEKTQEMLDFFYTSLGEKAPVSGIYIHGDKSDGSISTHCAYHTDGDLAEYLSSTMLIPLNADEDIEGGELLYLGNDGPIDAGRTQGKAFAHSHDVLHATTPHKGLRITLHIHVDQDPVPQTQNLLEGTALE